MEATKRLYEAMFLVDSAQAGSDWDGTLAAINKVLERADAEVVMLRKWADKKLAYEIAHKSRGTYILSYFKALPQMIGPLEKDVNLSEKIIRVLVLSTEGRPESFIEKDLSGESPAPVESDESQEESDGVVSQESEVEPEDIQEITEQAAEPAEDTDTAESLADTDTSADASVSQESDETEQK